LALEDIIKYPPVIAHFQYFVCKDPAFVLVAQYSCWLPFIEPEAKAGGIYI